MKDSRAIPRRFIGFPQYFYRGAAAVFIQAPCPLGLEDLLTEPFMWLGSPCCTASCQGGLGQTWEQARDCFAALIIARLKVALGSYGVDYGLVSLAMASWGNDMSRKCVGRIATKSHGSYVRAVPLLHATTSIR